MTKQPDPAQTCPDILMTAVSLQNQLADERARSAVYAHNLNAHADRAAAAEQERDEYKAQRDSARMLCEIRTQQRDEATQEMNELRTQLHTAKTDNTTLAKQWKAVKDHTYELEKERAAAYDLLAERERDIQRLADERDEARADSELWRNSSYKAIADRDHARAIVEELGEQATRRAAAYGERCRELDDRRGRAEAAEANYHAMRKDNLELRARIAELEAFQQGCTNNFHYQQAKRERDAAYARIAAGLNALMPEDA